MEAVVTRMAGELALEGLSMANVVLLPAIAGHLRRTVVAGGWVW
jgi:hypothetical protein